MISRFSNFWRVAIMGLCLTIFVSCRASNIQSQEPAWKNLIRQSLEAKLSDEDKSISLSFRLNAMAALEGDGQGLFGLCQYAVDGGMPSQWAPFAEGWCLEAAEQSYPGAATYLAENYKSGVFGEVDETEAERWFAEAKLDQENAVKASQHFKNLRDKWGRIWASGPCEAPVRRSLESFKPTLEEITELAENGDTAAMMFLAGNYYNGHGVEQSDEAYLNWITRAAEAGHSRGAWALGQWYNGKYRDRKKALAWYEKSIHLGLGAYDFMHTNPVRFVRQLRAEESLKKSNQISDEVIIERLGGVGLKGQLEDDTLMCEVALELRENLGREFRHCHTLPRYYPKQGLRHNRSDSLLNLRSFARHAFYSDARAEDWYQRVLNQMKTTAQAGNPDYADALSHSCDGDVKCIENWENAAISGYEKLASQGDKGAMYNLASIYSGRYHSQQIGNSFPTVASPVINETLSNEWLSKAIKEYKLAAERGDPDALFNLGFFYEKAIGVEKNRELARSLFVKFLGKNSPERLSYFQISGGHSSIFNELRKTCRKNGKEIDPFPIMTGNLDRTDLEGMECGL